MIAVTNGT